jgi:precorrin-4/cobalt-precorrin-4 C11-methyltransferase
MRSAARPAVLAWALAGSTAGLGVIALVRGKVARYLPYATVGIAGGATITAFAAIPTDLPIGVYAAAAALLGTELTVPELAQTVVLTRTQARSTRMPETEALPLLARSRASMVLHLAITRIRLLVDDLVPEYGADCPVAVVAHAERPQQLILRGRLADIADQVEAAGLRHTAVILVGRALAAGEVRGSHLYDPARQR